MGFLAITLSTRVLSWSGVSICKDTRLLPKYHKRIDIYVNRFGAYDWSIFGKGPSSGMKKKDILQIFFSTLANLSLILTCLGAHYDIKNDLLTFYEKSLYLIVLKRPWQVRHQTIWLVMVNQTLENPSFVEIGDDTTHAITHTSNFHLAIQDGKVKCLIDACMFWILQRTCIYWSNGWVGLGSHVYPCYYYVEEEFKNNGHMIA